MMHCSTVLTLLIVAFATTAKTTSSSPFPSPSPSPWSGHTPRRPIPTQRSFEGCFAVTIACANAHVGVALLVWGVTFYFVVRQCKLELIDNNKQYRVVLLGILSFVSLEAILAWWFLNHRCYGVWNIIPYVAFFMILQLLVMTHNILLQVGLVILYVGWLSTWEQSLWLVLTLLFNLCFGACGFAPFALLIAILGY